MKQYIQNYLQSFGKKGQCMHAVLVHKEVNWGQKVIVMYT